MCDIMDDVITFKNSSKFLTVVTSLIFELECVSKTQNVGLLIGFLDYHVFIIINPENFGRPAISDCILFM